MQGSFCGLLSWQELPTEFPSVEDSDSDNDVQPLFILPEGDGDVEPSWDSYPVAGAHALQAGPALSASALSCTAGMTAGRTACLRRIGELLSNLAHHHQGHCAETQYLWRLILGVGYSAQVQ